MNIENVLKKPYMHMVLPGYFSQLKVMWLSRWYRRKGMIEFIGIMMNRIFFLTLLYPQSWGFRYMLWFYCYMRVIDDAVDGDGPAPSVSKKKYITDRLRLAKRIFSDTSSNSFEIEPEEVLLLNCLHEGYVGGVNPAIPIQEIGEVFLWDYSRREDGHLVSEAECCAMARKQDIAFMTFFLLSRGKDADQLSIDWLVDKLGALNGLFTRHDWMLDIVEDLKEGIVTVSADAVETYHLDIETLKSCHTLDDLFQVPGFRDWYCAEISDLEPLWEKAMEEFFPVFSGFFQSSVADFVIGYVARSWKKDFEKMKRNGYDR